MNKFYFLKFTHCNFLNKLLIKIKTQNNCIIPPSIQHYIDLNTHITVNTLS
ncbi:hypothetical protein XSR1_40104 [Xenorhabdus szentirmaii DSM 16338]|uniref:Uncharacterized protein n=1 Tax=Xenorhabdus szentirmaii DSM 16338 TaxID=1427518 RepID=W1J1Y4_9GAMM|nr:hypothetical protein XSR1_40104 [Xenorhabdus szentirmaii DSM 16338]